MTECTILYTTFPSEQKAQEIGEDLIRSQLARCVNIFPSVVSIYEWNGQIARENEAVMIIKAPQGNSADIIEEIKRLHPYDTPAILTLPVEGGNEEFLRWVRG